MCDKLARKHPNVSALESPYEIPPIVPHVPNDPFPHINGFHSPLDGAKRGRFHVLSRNHQHYPDL